MDLMVGPDGSVRHSYNAGFVVLSYLVSLAGCCTALELLHRRTGARGIYNWYVVNLNTVQRPSMADTDMCSRYLLLAAASSMGAVAIWSMHFIGNRAIIMDRGQPSAEIQYSPGWTAASFFVPTVVIGIAFFIYNIREKSSCAAIAFGGVLTGTSVCGMHFMGQGGIANYAPRYLWYYVVGSALIAICATTITLGTFFYFKSHWTDNWWKRSLLASFLAAAVSAMHWVATAGTIYRAKEYHVQATRGRSRRTTVIVVINLVRSSRRASELVDHADECSVWAVALLL